MYAQHINYIYIYHLYSVTFPCSFFASVTAEEGFKIEYLLNLLGNFHENQTIFLTMDKNTIIKLSSIKHTFQELSYSFTYIICYFPYTMYCIWKIKIYHRSLQFVLTKIQCRST